MHATRALLSLLDVVACQESEAQRDIGFVRRVGESSRRLAGHIVEMWSVSANDRSQRDHSVVALTTHGAAHCEGKLPCTGHPVNVDVLERGAVPHQRVECTVHERARDGFIESACDDRDAPSLAPRRTTQLGHSGSEKVAQLVPLRVEVIGVLSRSGLNYRHSFLHGEAVPFEADQLARVVRERTELLDSDVEKYLRADAVVAKIGLEAK